MSEEYRYEVHARWTEGRAGIAKAGGVTLPMAFAAPPEFKGELGKWTPEHFLVAAVVSCFLVTVRGIAENSNLEILDLDVGAEGVLRQEQGGWRFAEIKLTPTVAIAREQDRDLALKVLTKEERGCLVARGLAFPVTMEATVRDHAQVLVV